MEIHYSAVSPQVFGERAVLFLLKPIHPQNGTEDDLLRTGISSDKLYRLWKDQQVQSKSYN